MAAREPIAVSTDIADTIDAVRREAASEPDTPKGGALTDSVVDFVSEFDLRSSDGTSPAEGTDADGQAQEPIELETHSAHGGACLNVPYTAPHEAVDWKRQLDVHFPIAPTTEADAARATRRPLVVHIHGGGWVRGDRSIGFYGAPSMAEAYAKMGFVAVTPSYRLGQYPHFLTDVAAALLFATDGRLADAIAASSGGQSATTAEDGSKRAQLIRTAAANGIVLSGHSAGAHIVATLTTCGAALRSWLADLPNDGGARLSALLESSLRAVVLLSGIYALRNPFGGSASNWRNCVFHSMYMRRAFLPFGADLDALSPAWQAARFLPPEHPQRAALVASTLGAPKGDALDTTVADATEAPLLLRVPCAVFSAACDLGLEHDAARFHGILSAARQAISSASAVDESTTARSPTATDGALSYTVVKGTSHPSICLKATAHAQVAAALHALLNSSSALGGSASPRRS